MKCIIYFLFMLIPSVSSALMPIKGLVLGSVENVSQKDPLTQVFSSSYTDKDLSTLEDENIKSYIGMINQGIALKNQCSKTQRVRYSNSWKEATAKRSIISTLQYIGLDRTVKFIAEYSKKFELTDDKYEMMTNNLVNNFCSQNLSVYSLKLLKSNFNYFWKNKTNVKIQDISSSPFYSKYSKQSVNTYDAHKRIFNFTLKNFKSLCSWNGDVDNLFLLDTYAKNPFLMSIIFNHLNQQKISFDKFTNEIVLTSNPNSVQVACENMICRRREKKEFEDLFPRMIGSTKLNEDLKFIYCEKFSQYRTKYAFISSQQKEWIKKRSIVSAKLEVQNLISLLTGFPDFFVTSEKYTDIYTNLKMNIKDRWDKWSEIKLNAGDSNLLYEEPLEIKLITKALSSDAENGNFSVNFNINLGELDKVITDYDKIDFELGLTFSNKYLGNLRKVLTDLHNRGKYKLKESELDKFRSHIKYQLLKTSPFIKIPIASDSFVNLIGGEIISQINFYRGRDFKKLAFQEIKIPVKFKIGLFALRYFRLKYKSDRFNLVER